MTSIEGVQVIHVIDYSSTAVILALGWRDGNAGLGCFKKRNCSVFTVQLLDLRARRITRDIGTI